MTEAKTYELGEVVVIDPLQTGKGPKGRIIGKTQWLDGTSSYTVRTVDYGANGIVTHSMAAYDMSKVE